MRITSKNFNLSKANETAISKRLDKYTDSVNVEFNHKTKVFKMSCKLSNVNKGSSNYNQFFTSTGEDFYSVLTVLKNKLKNSYSKTDDFNNSKVSMKGNFEIEIVEDDYEGMLSEDDF